MSRVERRKTGASQGAGGTFGAAALAATAVVLAVAAAWPIYETAQLWITVGVAAMAAFAIVWLGTALRWGGFTLVALVLAFVALVLPVATPQVLASGPDVWGILRGLGDALAAVALGWKQLLTLTLPVGSYQTVLVPLFTLVFVVVAASTALARGGRRAAVFAALPMLALSVFGTVFGSSAVSSPLGIGPLTVVAPRETGLWIGAVAAAAAWMVWAAGRDRRDALKRGRIARAAAPGGGAGVGAARRNTLARGGSALLVAALAVTVGAVAAPALSGSTRAVPRDSVDPEVVVREQVSPLAEYRSFKRDDSLRDELFSVEGAGALPSRLRIAVLDGYDGVDFFVGDPGGTGRFTRFPSGSRVTDPAKMTVRIGQGYTGVWVPLATPLAAPPQFRGPRAAELADSFYVNRDTGAAVAVPTAAGLKAGDAFTATVSAAPDPVLGAAPAHTQPLIDSEEFPQLTRWLEMQGVSPTASGLESAINSLRARGYLSHSLTDGDGENAWLTESGADAPTSFVSSPGGHSTARVEQLFSQLIEQQEAAGDRAPDEELVAAIGDDEQFATAAALLARALGYDSRVVVGVRVGAESAGVPGVPACADVCEGRHVAAWIEAKGADGVWAPLDVSPQTEVPPLLVQKGEQLPEFPTTPEERDASESEPPVGSSNDDGTAEDEPERQADRGVWPLVRTGLLLAAAAALLALALLFIPLVKRVRRRVRARQPLPELRALGAWNELVDHCTDTGNRPRFGGSRSDIVAELSEAGVMSQHGAWIAATVDQAVYAREGVSDEAADHLWAVVREHIRERDARLGFWGRLRSQYWLGSFIASASARSRPRPTPRNEGASS
ncbi:transglutaminase domain-containing protein [Leucobacter sp. NPDC015123]|uniref:transglutaminase domain-containing protein n=1 Tax=Leucobacter sp. NPDC015123 TaxID=3364129 RepID=UPI0036F49E1B